MVANMLFSIHNDFMMLVMMTILTVTSLDFLTHSLTHSLTQLTPLTHSLLHELLIVLEMARADGSDEIAPDGFLVFAQHRVLTGLTDI